FRRRAASRRWARSRRSRRRSCPVPGLADPEGQLWVCRSYFLTSNSNAIRVFGGSRSRTYAEQGSRISLLPKATGQPVPHNTICRSKNVGPVRRISPSPGPRRRQKLRPETYKALLVAADPHVGERLGGDQHPIALLLGDVEHIALSRERFRALHCDIDVYLAVQLSRYVLHSNSDLHVCTLSSGCCNDHILPPYFGLERPEGQQWALCANGCSGF